MGILSEVRAMIDPLKHRLTDMLLTAVVDRVIETTKLRTLKLQVLVDDDDDGVPHVEPYGWSSRALRGAEAILVNIGADADQVLALLVFDRRYRPTNLVDGEVIMFDDLGQYVKLARAALKLEAPTIELGAGATKGVNREGDTIFANQDFGIWLAAVATATGAGPAPSPHSVTGSGSSVVQAVD